MTDSAIDLSVSNRLPAAPQRVPWRVKRNDASSVYGAVMTTWSFNMRGILLWLLGIPIPIIILLYIFGVF
ncbi:hypothetical protein [Ferrovibrio terrae]|uniref:hypothetical protein n=1 Tax=Ferrovibrio terrae TaxID=2594003 RepID=UPI003137D695